MKPQVSEYGSVDPAPPSSDDSLMRLETTLLDEDERMFLRMRAVFALRNNRSRKAIEILCSAFSCASALLKHEVAYVLGQMQDQAALPTLAVVLADESEHVMVRHEAAEAIGAIGDQGMKDVLEKYVDDPCIEVAESCIVALDLLAFCNSEDDREVQW